MYFLVGANPEKSMFQFSLKYRFFNEDDPIAEKRFWLTHIFFAYTQTSFWDLKSKSMPFEDTSYQPEFFFQTTNFRKKRTSWLGMFFKVGAQHESNGQSEELSRSTNYFYIQPIMIFYHKSSQYGLQLAPKFWLYLFNENETNPDLKDYRGYFDLQIKFGKADSLVVDTHFWSARKGSSVQCDLAYPLNRQIKNSLNFYLHAQYANRLVFIPEYCKVCHV